MLTVVAPATAKRLTTAARARAWLGLLPTVPTDEVLNAQIEAASQAVVDFCRRSFGRETVRETLRDGVDLRDPVLLARSPVVSALTVTLDGTLLVAATDYEVESGILYRLGGSRRMTWCGLLTVQYTAGYALPEESNPTLPASVERAAILVVGAYCSAAGRDPTVKSESVEGVGSLSWWVQGQNDPLPSPEAAQLLQPYRAAAWRTG